MCSMVKLCDLSEPQFLHLQNGTTLTLILQCYGSKGISPWKSGLSFPTSPGTLPPRVYPHKEHGKLLLCNTDHNSPTE